MINRGYFADMLGGVRKGFRVGRPGSGFFVAFAIGGFHRFAWASGPSLRPPATRIRSLQFGPLTCVTELPRVRGRSETEIQEASGEPSSARGEDGDSLSGWGM